MNRHAKNIIGEFNSIQNRRYLFTTLLNEFHSPAVDQFLYEHFAQNLASFVARMQKEIALSDSMPGMTVADEVRAFNLAFLRDRCDFIRKHVLPDTQIIYSVTDGNATSRYDLTHHQRSANDILQAWQSNPARGIQSREDPQAKGTPLAAAPHIETGITFCDQSETNTSNHVSQFFTPMMKQMNTLSPEDAHCGSGFGTATVESDRRLQSRRVFRSNESGEENGILNREKRLQRRNLDRDVSENLRGTGEMGCHLSGHDMSSLYRRMDARTATAAALTPDRGDLRPQHNYTTNNARANQSMRYC